MAKSFCSFVMLLVFSAVTAAPAAEPGANSEQLERVQKHLNFLAGDECQGRGLETTGLVKAGQYIADQFKAYGLKPAFTEGYFQPFDVPAPSKLGTPQTLTLKKGDMVVEPKATTGFVATVASAGGKSQGGVVFVGYGITSTDPAYDDYAGVDVKGKVVIVLRRVPQAGNPHGPFGPNNPAAALVSKVQNAAQHGATGVLFVSDAVTADKTDSLMTADQTRGSQLNGPVLHVKRDVIDRVLAEQKTSLTTIENDIDKTLKPNSFELAGWTAEAEVTVVKRSWPTRNVVGVCEGSGPLAKETVVIGAHYDHLGSGEPGSFPGNSGKTHYGADDNASGTTGLLELARRYGAMKDRQGRRIVFIAFSGEEQGLHGSKYYCDHPAFPIEDTAFMLNMDMIGRVTEVEDEQPNGGSGKKDRLVVYGTGTSSGLADRVQSTNKEFGFKLFTIPGGTGPSDHTSFYQKGVPVLFFFTGTHKDYHRPTDTPDKVNTTGLLKVVDYVQSFADHYASVPKRPDFLKTKGGEEDPTNPSPQTGRVGVPKIKFTPGNYGEEDRGVLVEAVEAGGPAEKGGMKAGDYIIEIAGQPVRGMTGYMQAMGTVKPDVDVEIVVQRKDQKVKLTVRPIP